jgi:hypothetical protein
MINRRNLIKAAAFGAAGSTPTWLAAVIEAQAQQPPPFPAPARPALVNGVTFTVDSVQPGAEPMPAQPVKDTISALLNSPNQPLESWSTNTPALVQYPPDALGIHPFLLAVNTAYDKHYPLVLSPDMIWLLILQGLASHVNANAEVLRKKFVAHEGKLVLNVKRDAFQKGNPSNDWAGVFAEFSSELRTHIGPDSHGLIVNEFSTTGAVEKAATEVSLMDTLHSYFVYGITTSCGFPSITLEGTTSDWQQLRGRAQLLSDYDLDWWIPSLLPVLDQFVLASQNQPDNTFWCDFFKLAHVGSGDRPIQGHIVNLFPYLGHKRPSNAQLVADYETFIRSLARYAEAQVQAELAKFQNLLEHGDTLNGIDTLRRNPFIGKGPLKPHEGITTDAVSTKMSSAPMIWDYFGTSYQMELLAGFIGATQDRTTLAIRPTIGWAVRQALA